MKASVRKAATPRRRTAIRHTERRLITQHPRRRILSLAAGAAALPAISRVAGAQSYPSKPITVIVPFPAGGATDAIGRVVTANDFAPIAPLVKAPIVLFARKTLPARDLNEFIAWLRANPDKASA
jgi:tripartite-type tricarboxylate transporter receptor subunit TctC